MVFCMTGYKGHSLLALPLSAKGDISGSKFIVWSTDRGTPYIASPLLYDDMLYFTQSLNESLTCLDSRTGKTIIDRARLPGLRRIYASPIGADGRVYIMGRNGTTLVLERSTSLKILATNRLDDKDPTSPAIAGNQLFLRGANFLYCIAKDGSPR